MKTYIIIGDKEDDKEINMINLLYVVMKYTANYLKESSTNLIMLWN